ncbi:hypothetical protein IPM44_03510 [bacterium]|jgi:hypothetical protein|nr:MAG: hypothetical protein IPM44_03510 [bacterium]
MHDKIPEPLSRPVEPNISGSNVPPVSSAPSATASSTPMGMPASNVGKPSKGKAVLVVLLILILMASTAAFGYLWWQARSAQAQVSQAQTDKAATEKKLAEAETKVSELEKSSKEATEAPKKTDEELLKQWASDQCALTGKTLEKFTLTLVEGDFAQLTYICKGDNESPSYYLKKVNDQWYLVYQGLGPIPASDRTKYSIPSGFPSNS